MSIAGDIIAGVGLGLSIIALIYTWIKTGKKGPRIGIYGVEYDTSDFVRENQRYWIRIKTCFENYGDKTTDIIIRPELILYDSQGIKLANTTDLPIIEQFCEMRIGVPNSEPKTEDLSFYLLAFSGQWIKGIITFNTHYFKKQKLRRKWKRIELK